MRDRTRTIAPRGVRQILRRVGEDYLKRPIMEKGVPTVEECRRIQLKSRFWKGVGASGTEKTSLVPFRESRIICFIDFQGW